MPHLPPRSSSFTVSVNMSTRSSFHSPVIVLNETAKNIRLTQNGRLAPKGLYKHSRSGAKLVAITLFTTQQLAIQPIVAKQVVTKQVVICQIHTFKKNPPIQSLGNTTAFELCQATYWMAMCPLRQAWTEKRPSTLHALARKNFGQARSPYTQMPKQALITTAP